jgi:LPS O-antigen subunit length determinant protein (WzzB/FepE family)
MSLNVKKVITKQLKSKGRPDIEQSTYHINRTDNKTINTKLFNDIYNTYQKKFGADNVLVRAVNNEGMRTLKAFGESEVNLQEFHQYYQNRVKDTTQFEFFYSLEITIKK